MRRFMVFQRTGSHYYEVDRLQWGTLFTDCEMPETNLNGEQDAWKAQVATSQRVLNGSDAEARTSVPLSD